MCAVCYNPQYKSDVYSRCVQSVAVHSIAWCVFCLLPYHEMPPKHIQFSTIQKVTIMERTDGIVRLEGDKCHLMLNPANKLTAIRSCC